MDWAAMAGPWLRVEAETDAAHMPVLEGLLARAQLQTGQHVLDIGPGGGVSLVKAAEAVGPTGHVTGIEIAPPFVERARERAPANVSVVEGDAARHPFAPHSFDAAISFLGTMFFADTVAAFAHIRTALKSGGQMTFASWAGPEVNPYFTVPAAVATSVLGPGDTRDPDAPGPMRFHDADALRDMLVAAGWSARVEVADLLLTPRGSVADFAKMQGKMGAGAMRMRLAKEAGRLTDDHRKAMRDGLEAALAQFDTADGIRVPARIHYAIATA